MAEQREVVIAKRYRLLGTVGQGGMGAVWHARDEVLGRDVAVKEVVLPRYHQEADRQNAYRRTLREARSAARLSHPGVVTVHDVLEEDGRPWIVMELVRARSLQQVIEQDGPLAPVRVARIGEQILSALSAAHAVGILHRDVKPSNVLLGVDDHVVLTDFGIARNEGDVTLTQTGQMIGSPQYMAPERAGGGPSVPASDIWALGATLYAAVEGRPPFHRDDMMGLLAAVLKDDPPLPVKAGPLLPVLEGLLRKDPDQRMTAVTAAAALQQVASGPAVPWTPVPGHAAPMMPAPGAPPPTAPALSSIPRHGAAAAPAGPELRTGVHAQIAAALAFAMAALGLIGRWWDDTWTPDKAWFYQWGLSVELFVAVTQFALLVLLFRLLRSRLDRVAQAIGLVSALALAVRVLVSSINDFTDSSWAEELPTSWPMTLLVGVAGGWLLLYALAHRAQDGMGASVAALAGLAWPASALAVSLSDEDARTVSAVMQGESEAAMFFLLAALVSYGSWALLVSRRLARPINPQHESTRFQP